ncbi:hypothetical protein HHI36_003171 [Cryptolaemus montrouzieri]|uniref:Adenylate kinase n=1 Tax=Cryptolaemus montrouzieri TaxID=559131 RepID=A0ABD2PCN7_9CUCU
MASSNLKLVILCAPVTEKIRICNNISKTFHLKHLISGQILKKKLLSGIPEVKQMEFYMKNKEIIPDEIINPIIFEEMSNYNSWLIDGFPRTVGQAEILSKQTNLNLVLNIDVPFKEFAKMTSKTVLQCKMNQSDISCSGNNKLTKELVSLLHQKLKAIKNFKKLIQPVVAYYEFTELFRNFEAYSPDIWENIKSTIEKHIESV